MSGEVESMKTMELPFSCKFMLTGYNSRVSHLESDTGPNYGQGTRKGS